MDGRRKSWWSAKRGGAPMWGWTLIGTLVIAMVAVLTFAVVRPAPAPTAVAGPAGGAAATQAPTTPSSTKQKPPPQARPTGRPTRLLFVGTSITGGMAATDQYYAYAWLVQKALEQGGPVDRVSIPARREPPNTARTVFSYDVAAIPQNVDIAIVELVTNDISRSEFSDYRTRYNEFVDTLRTRNRNATIVCVGAWTYKQGPSARYDAAARQACEQSGGRFVPISGIFGDELTRGPSSNRSTFGADDFHPNNLGSMRIATEVLYALRGFYPGVGS